MLYDNTNTLFKHYKYDSALEVDEWAPVFISWSGTDLKLFISNIEITPSTTVNAAGTMEDSQRGIVVGAAYTSPRTNFLSAFLGEIMIWNKVLSSNEITQIQACSLSGSVDWNRGFGAYNSSPNLVHWWKPGASLYDPGKDYTGNISIGSNADSSNYVGSNHCRVMYGVDTP